MKEEKKRAHTFTLFLFFRSIDTGDESPRLGFHHHHHGVVVGSSSSHPASRKDIDEVLGQEAATALMVDHLHLQVNNTVNTTIQTRIRAGSQSHQSRRSASTASNSSSFSSSSAFTGHHHDQANMPPTTSNSRDYKIT